MTITEFLLARIEEDEARAASGWSSLRDPRWETDNYGRDFLTPSAVLAECAAKRATVRRYESFYATRRANWMDPSYSSAMTELKYVLSTFVAVYKDHPDYRQEWNL